MDNESSMFAVESGEGCEEDVLKWYYHGGRITRDGIQCNCCSKGFTLTAFEHHAGSTNHRPAANIILDDGTGRSLSDCQRQARDSMKVIISTSSTHPSHKTVKVSNSFNTRMMKFALLAAVEEI
ncbi:hypothetical protein F3Y22_tig00002840pilonHSYRG01006 [Hibiscus syriacus]|uniref:Tify domain-containing protein n=1 Tax=Hibiscus syriacus TaxID=106335 RepID=A0A6A3CQU5_HIBSY|nr:hypothetical protein F3Y22_tig00002840pilonHSYRG01006 [Hibiscus syriacus]